MLNLSSSPRPCHSFHSAVGRQGRALKRSGAGGNFGGMRGEGLGHDKDSVCGIKVTCVPASSSILTYECYSSSPHDSVLARGRLARALLCCHAWGFTRRVITPPVFFIITPGLQKR